MFFVHFLFIGAHQVDIQFNIYRVHYQTKEIHLETVSMR